MNKYFTTDFLFNINSVIPQRSDKTLLVIGAAAVALAVVMKLAAVYAPTPTDKKFRNKLFSLFMTVGLWEVLWFLFRYQNIRFFGSHFVALLGLLIGFIWLVFIAKDIFRNYKTERQDWEKEQVKMKYLPRN